MVNPTLLDFEEIGRNWRSFFLFGLVLVGLGLASAGAVLVGTIGSVVFFGVVLGVSGVIEVFLACCARHSSGLLLRVLVGVLHAAGGFLITYPLASVAALALLLSWLFLTSGLIRTLIAGLLRYPAWGWALLEGAGAAIVALVILARWPISALWVIGMFVGTDLVFRGLAWLMFGLGARHLDFAPDLLEHARNA